MGVKRLFPDVRRHQDVVDLSLLAFCADVCRHELGLLLELRIRDDHVLSGRPALQPLSSRIARFETEASYCFALIRFSPSNLGIEISCEYDLVFLRFGF